MMANHTSYSDTIYPGECVWCLTIKTAWNRKYHLGVKKGSTTWEIKLKQASMCGLGVIVYFQKCVLYLKGDLCTL